MPTKQEKALDALKKLNLGKEHKNRAEELLKNPILVNQSTFGVCGMAAVIRALLELEPERFVALLKSIFETGKFATAEGMAIKIDRAKLQSMFKTNLTKGSSHVELSKNPNMKFELDFIVSRSLGQIAEKMDPRLFQEQRDFTQLFMNPTKDSLKTFIAQGHLALQTKCLEFILEKIIGVQRYQKMKTDTETSFSYFVDGANKLFSKSADTFVIVSINDFSRIFSSVMEWDDPTKSYKKKVAITRISGNFDYHKNKSLAKYTHWVVVKKIIGSASDCYKISFWSWGYDVDDVLIEKKVAHTYMREVIIACMSDDKSYVDEFDKVSRGDFKSEKSASVILMKGQSHIPSLAAWNSKFLGQKHKDEAKSISKSIDTYHKTRLHPKADNHEKFLALKELSHHLSECRQKLRLQSVPQFADKLSKSKNPPKDLLTYIDKHIEELITFELSEYSFIPEMDLLEECIKKEKENMKSDYQAFTYVPSTSEWKSDSWMLLGKRKDITIIDQVVEEYNGVFSKKGSKEERKKALKAISDKVREYQKRKGETGSPRMQAVFNLDRLVKKEEELLRTAFV